MQLDAKICYSAVRSRDSRFDGRFFFGVASTGIYCRPVCRARMPKEENCSYFGSAAAAESAGFRPCLRCRPELAPGLARGADDEARMARLAALRMEADGLCDQSLAGQARSLGISDRHLRRLFAREYGVTPVVWLQTRRLLSAKLLLAETSLPIMQVAMDAGFGSLRRMNDLFRRNYALTPADIRRTTGTGHATNESITVSLAYRPPFAWDTLLEFLRDRAIPGVELVDSTSYSRTVVLSHRGAALRGWITLANRPERSGLAVTISPSLFPVINHVLARVRFLCDLNCSPSEIQDTLGSMQVGQEHVFEAGLRVPGCFDPFEMSVRAILGQQVTVKAARTLAWRIAERFGEPLQTPFRDLNTTFPTVEVVCGLSLPVEDHLGPLGVTGARARSIRALAETLQRGEIRLGPGADPEREMGRLAELPGFGPWTVQYLAMRALGWPDAFPHTDIGVKKALGNLSADEIQALAREWAPWRSYATVSLWNHLKKIKCEKTTGRNSHER